MVAPRYSRERRRADNAVGQSPDQGHSPFLCSTPPAGHSPASHPAAKPLARIISGGEASFSSYIQRQSRWLAPHPAAKPMSRITSSGEALGSHHIQRRSPWLASHPGGEAVVPPQIRRRSPWLASHPAAKPHSRLTSS